MNAGLRGQLKSKTWVDAYKKLALDSASAFKKAPKGTNNLQGGGRVTRRAAHHAARRRRMRVVLR